MVQPVRRVVTGKDANGKAVVIFDGPNPHVQDLARMGVGSVDLWQESATPASLAGNDDKGVGIAGILPPDNGSVFRVVEFAPESTIEADDAERLAGMAHAGVGPEGAQAGNPRHPVMHRTRTIDYGVVISGEIDMMMDDSEVHLKAGDVFIQRGTNHAWVNRSDKPCQVAVVLIDAKD